MPLWGARLFQTASWGRGSSWRDLPFLAVVSFGSNTPSRSPGQSQSRKSAKLFLQPSEFGLPPPPHPPASVPPTFRSGGRGTLAGERRGGEGPQGRRQQKLWFSSCSCVVSLLQLPGIIFPLLGDQLLCCCRLYNKYCIFELYISEHYFMSLVSYCNYYLLSRQFLF